MKLMKRKDVPVELTWDLTALYAREEDWKADMEAFRRLTDELERDYKGKLTAAPVIQACLDRYRVWLELADRAGNYAQLAGEVDFGDAALQERSETFSRIYAQAASRLSFIDSEIIAQDEALLRDAAAQGGPNAPYLEALLRQKPYQLQPETERVLAALSPTLDAPYQIYSQAKLVDMKFPPFAVDGREYPWATPSTRTSTSTPPIQPYVGRPPRPSTPSCGSMRTSPLPPIRPRCRVRKYSRTSGVTAVCSTTSSTASG